MRIRNDKVVVDQAEVEKEIKDLLTMNLNLRDRIDDLDIMLSDLISAFKAYAIASGLLIIALVVAFGYIILK